MYRIGEPEVDLPRRRVAVALNTSCCACSSPMLERSWPTGRSCGRSGGLAHAEQQNILRVNISHLRQKIEKDPSRPRYIVTEPGVGYRLKSE